MLSFVADRLSMSGKPSAEEEQEPEAMEVMSGKRPVEEEVAQQPEAKRMKGATNIEDRIGEVCKSLEGAELTMPWSGSLRKLLLGLAPEALGASQEQRTDNGQATLNVLGEIFGVEEVRVKERVEGAQAKVRAAGENKAKAQDAEKEAAETLKQCVKECDDKFQALPEDVVLVREAEAKLNQGMQELLFKQEQRLRLIKKDCFEPLKTGSWSNDTEKEHFMALLLPLLRQSIRGDEDLASSRDALLMKPDARKSFATVLVQQLDETLDNCISAVGAFAAGMQTQVDATAVEKVTPEQAEALLNLANGMELAGQRVIIIEAKRDSFKLLVSGAGSPAEQRKHLAILKRIFKSIPDGKNCFAKGSAALQKKCAERSDSDRKCIDELEEALDNRISALAEQVGEGASAKEADCRRLEQSLDDVKESVATEGEYRDGKQQMLASKREALLELKSSSWESLKAGAWETPQALKPLLSGLKKLFKNVDFDGDQLAVKTLTDVLKKKPEERAAFDNVLVQQLDESIERRLAEFEQESTKACSSEAVEKFEAVKEAVKALESVQKDLEKLRVQQRAHLSEAVSAEKRSKQQELTLEQKQNAAKEMEQEEKQADECRRTEQGGLEQLQNSSSSLTFLRDRADPATLGA